MSLCFYTVFYINLLKWLNVCVVQFQINWKTQTCTAAHPRFTSGWFICPWSSPLHEVPHVLLSGPQTPCRPWACFPHHWVPHLSPYLPSPWLSPLIFSADLLEADTLLCSLPTWRLHSTILGWIGVITKDTRFWYKGGWRVNWLVLLPKVTSRENRESLNSYIWLNYSCQLLYQYGQWWQMLRAVI